MKAYDVQLSGAVANFCDPESYPDVETITSLKDLGVRTTIGIHPKKARDHSGDSAALGTLAGLVQHPDVVGVGEVGLDHSVPSWHWSKQHELLDAILPHLEERHTLVLHCRGRSSEDCEEAYSALLYHCVGVAAPSQRIHLHCFTGTLYVVRQWVKHFPNVHFGFTAKTGHFQRKQKAALQSLDTSQILLETDAPHLPTPGYTTLAPSSCE